MLLCLTAIAVCAWKGRLLQPVADEELSPELIPFYLITFSIPENVTQPPKAVVPLFRHVNARTGF